MDDELTAKLNAVVDAQSFLAFVHAIVADRQAAVEVERRQPSSPYGPDAGGWENGSIEAFLEAAVSWAEDSSFGARQGRATDNPWKRFAAFLIAGKYYE